MTAQTIGTITLTPTTLTVGGTTTASATATSGLSVTFASATANICTVAGSTVTGIATGTCTITASQAGNGSYSAAAPINQNISVNGVTCDKAEVVQGQMACLMAATLDGQAFHFGFSPSGAAIDVDQDGASDLILNSIFFTQNATPTPVSFFKGAGNGRDFTSFTAVVSGAGNAASALFTRNVLVGDFNGDGKQDFYLADGTEYSASGSFPFLGTTQYVYISGGAGHFTKVDSGVGIKTVHGSAVGNPAKDGFALVLNTPWQPFASSPNWVNFLSVSAGGAVTDKSILYSDPLFAPLSASNGGFPYLTAIDVNGDGARDIVMLGRYGNNNNVLWLNDGHGNFTLSKIIPNWVSGLNQAENAEVADLNGDGLQDMVVMHIDRTTNPQTTNSTLRVWINDGQGGFVDQTDTWLGSNYQNYTGGYFDYKIADLDGDGFPDLVFTTQPQRLLADGTAPAKVVVLNNRGGQGFNVVEFDSLKWVERFAAPSQWMPGSVVIYPVNGKPTVMFSMNGQVYNVRFSTAPVATPSTLINIATRGQVLTGDNVMIGGFIIQGTSPKTVLVRARGPSLGKPPFNVPGVIPNPTMALYSGQTVIASNDNWGDATNAPAIQASTFAPTDPLESAVLMTLNPGAYTAIVSGVNGCTGVGIVEVFEIDHPETPLINIATRGQVQTGDNVMIGGFIIQGTSRQSVLVRARGPSMALPPHNVPGTLANPYLTIYSGQTPIYQNDDWRSNANAAAIQATGNAPSNDNEAALLITLDPGAYTAIVNGVGGTSGIGIVEVFAQ
jgi:hypothetical protein